MTRMIDGYTCGTSTDRLSLHVNRLRLACGLALLSIACTQARAATETVLHSFSSPPKGANPQAGVVRDSAGSFYGTTVNGGSAGYGVVFSASPTGKEKVLYSFTGGSDGAYPYGGVVRDSAGNLYGTTNTGGAAGYGVVFKVTATGQETVLYSFTGGVDGGNPYAGVILDSAGNLYGTTYSGGGPEGAGVVFKIDTSNQETVLYTFTGGADGGNPYAAVIRDSAGNLYGTASYGGAHYAGVVFKVSASAQETVLYDFTDGVDGGYPYSGVITDSAGNLYGTTRSGGDATYSGVVYKLSASGQETVLHTFTGGADGGTPYGGVIRDSAGNLYGTTNYGGTAQSGVVFKINTSAQETVLYTFSGGADGSTPYAGVIRDSAGNLYGTTSNGGTGNVGIVFEVDTTGHESPIYSFSGVTDGSTPWSSVIRDSSGNFYGTTVYGGTAGWGTVYALAPNGHETVLYTFTGGADGGLPYGDLIRDTAGNLYGTTSGGGSGYGVVYKVSPAGQETPLYRFTGGADGAYPIAGVIMDSSGNLYGTTTSGGTGYGVVYKLSAAGHESVLYTFAGGTDGAIPDGGVIRDSSGNLYGTTFNGGESSAGLVFKLNANGHETVLYNFSGAADGGYPHAGVVRDSAGNLYGTGQGGGASYSGVVFKLSPSGQETVLYSFTGGADGQEPAGTVALDSSGNLYGTTYLGGLANSGVVYKVSAAGQETVLYNFTGGADGARPLDVVIRDSAGNLYGTASGGGKGNAGVIFKLVP